MWESSFWLQVASSGSEGSTWALGLVDYCDSGDD